MMQLTVRICALCALMMICEQLLSDRRGMRYVRIAIAGRILTAALSYIRSGAIL